MAKKKKAREPKDVGEFLGRWREAVATGDQHALVELIDFDCYAIETEIDARYHRNLPLDGDEPRPDWRRRIDKRTKSGVPVTVAKLIARDAHGPGDVTINALGPIALSTGFGQGLLVWRRCDGSTLEIIDSLIATMNGEIGAGEIARQYGIRARKLSDWEKSKVLVPIRQNQTPPRERIYDRAQVMQVLSDRGHCHHLCASDSPG